MSASNSLKRDLDFFERQLATIGRPRSPWERGLSNTYMALAERTRNQLADSDSPGSAA
jgi:hypothetical protein